MGQIAADQLRQIIIPDLVRLVGDAKLQRVSAGGVMSYLHRQQLFFDEQLLRNMFDEGDFKHEGYLGVGPLTGAIQGRYPLLSLSRCCGCCHHKSIICVFMLRFPKRRHGQADWLALVSIILQRPLQELQNLLAPTPSKRYDPGQTLTWLNLAALSLDLHHLTKSHVPSSSPMAGLWECPVLTLVLQPAGHVTVLRGSICTAHIWALA